MTGAEGRVSTNDSDSRGLVTESVQGAGSATPATESFGNSKVTAYNTAGLVSSVTDNLGRKEEYIYDADNRETSDVWNDAGGTTVDTLGGPRPPPTTTREGSRPGRSPMGRRTCARTWDTTRGTSAPARAATRTWPARCWRARPSGATTTRAT